MNKSKYLVGITVIGIAVSSTLPVSAFTITSFSGDQRFVDLKNDGLFTEAFVAESRIGDLGSAATYEQAILNPSNNNLPTQQEGFDWESGKEYNFTLKYDDTGVVTYTVGGTMLTSGDFSGSDINTLYLRGAAKAGSSFEYSTLAVNGQSLNNSLDVDATSLTSGREVGYLEIGGITQPFTLTGTQTLSWEGAAPTNSNLAGQIKVGQKVPEPLTIFGTLTGLGFGGFLKRKYGKKANS